MRVEAAACAVRREEFGIVVLTALQDGARPPRHVESLCVLEGELVANEIRATEASGSEDEQ